MGECLLIKRSTMGIPSGVYLYNEGDECIALTGGWNSLGVYGEASGSVLTKEPLWIQVIGRSTGSGFNHIFRTLNKINISGKSLLKIIVSSTSEPSNNNFITIHPSTFSTSLAYFNGENTGNLGKVLKAGLANLHEMSINVSSLNTSAHLYLGQQITSANKPLQTFKIHKVWLE